MSGWYYLLIGFLIMIEEGVDGLLSFVLFFVRILNLYFIFFVRFLIVNVVLVIVML